MKNGLIIFVAFLVLLSCNNQEYEVDEKEIILSGNREAPLGWVYLTVYDDTTFNFTLTGLREATHFPGKVTIVNDTIYFEYTDSIPKAGEIAIISDYNVSYIAGEYPENIGITLNKTVPNKK